MQYQKSFLINFFRFSNISLQFSILTSFVTTCIMEQVSFAAILNIYREIFCPNNNRI